MVSLTKVLGLFLSVGSCFWMLAPASASSHGETEQSAPAKGSSKENGKEKRSKKVYTNEDLKRLRETTPINQSPATSTSRSSQGSKKTKSATAAKEYLDIHGHDENYWQQKIRPLRRRVESLDLQIASLQAKQSKLNATSGLKVTRSGKLQATSDARAQLTKRLDDLEEKRADTLRSIQEVEEDARKAQALPEWLR
jgi:hypothetical protein